MTDQIVGDIINNIINNVVKSDNKKSRKSDEICLICHDPLEGTVYRFCCNKQYHEECLVSYVGINQYPKCPICRKWVKKDIKDACDIIYREYQLKNARKKLKLATEYTDDVSYFSRTRHERAHPNTDTETSTSDLVEEVSPDDIISHLEEMMNIPEPEVPIAAVLPIPVRGELRNIMRNQRTQLSMMQRMFDESWNNFFRQS